MQGVRVEASLNPWPSYMFVTCYACTNLSEAFLGPLRRPLLPPGAGLVLWLLCTSLSFNIRTFVAVASLSPGQAVASTIAGDTQLF